jgi:hypothetical protein
MTSQKPNIFNLYKNNIQPSTGQKRQLNINADIKELFKKQVISPPNMNPLKKTISKIFF